MGTFRSCKIRVYPQTSVLTLVQEQNEEKKEEEFDSSNESFSFFSLYFSDINEAFF